MNVIETSKSSFDKLSMPILNFDKFCLRHPTKRYASTSCTTLWGIKLYSLRYNMPYDSRFLWFFIVSHLHLPMKKGVISQPGVPLTKMMIFWRWTLKINDQNWIELSSFLFWFNVFAFENAGWQHYYVSSGFENQPW